MGQATRSGAGRRVLLPVLLVGIAVAALALFGLQSCPGDEDGGSDPDGHEEPNDGDAAAAPPASSRASGPGRSRRVESARSKAPTTEERAGRTMTVRIRGDAVAGTRVVLESLVATENVVLGERAFRRAALIGADGSARFEVLPPPPLVLRWLPLPKSTGWAVGGVRILRRIEDVEITVDPDGILRGVLVDRSGSGVPRRQIIGHRDRTSSWSDSPAFEVRSGADGGFEILLPPGRWWLHVPTEGRKGDSLAERCGPFETGREDVRIVLDGTGWGGGVSGASIAGTAKWPDGRPAVGWVWFLRATDPGETIVRTPHIATLDGSVRSPALVQGRLYDVVLRDDGGGRIGHGWALARDVPGGAGWVDFVAQPPRGAQGRVVNADGRAVAGVVVTATLRPDVTIDPFDLKATSDADGRFTFATVPPFALRFVAGGPGDDWCTLDPPHLAEGSSAEVLVRVVPTVAVAGRVVFEDGTPVGSGHVQASGRRAHVGRDGTFRIGSLLPGPVRVSWTPGTDFGFGPVELGTATAPSTDATLTLVLPR